MPVTNIISTPNGSTIAFWNITENVSDLEKRYKNRTSEKARYLQITSEKRKKEWLATRLLIRAAHSTKAEITYLKTGRPTLKDSTTSISITHSKNNVAIIINKAKNVAIDLEYHSKKLERVLSRFMNENELNFLKSCPQKEAATLIWCAKETLFKLIDNQGVDFKKDFTTLPFSPMHEGVIMSFINTTTPPLQQPLSYILNTAYALTYCEA